MADAFPLAWPAGWPRTPASKRSRPRFGGRGYNQGAASGKAQQFLLDELRRLGARNVVLSTNIELRRDGLPYARQTITDDPGVAVYFTFKGQQRVIPCDRWDRVADNMYAIALSIEALRGLDRWGAGNMVEAAFSGFRSLPPMNGTTGRGWWEVLGIPVDAARSLIEDAASGGDSLLRKRDRIRRSGEVREHPARPNRSGPTRRNRLG